MTQEERSAAIMRGSDVRHNGRRRWWLIVIVVSLSTLWVVWPSAFEGNPTSDSRSSDESTMAVAIDAVVDRIIGVESDGDPNAKSKRSSATGLAQFLDETWLDMIRVHRPDLTKGRTQAEILELRRDPKIAREITARFTEHNA